MDNKKFKAGIAVPPGDTLKEILNDQNMTQKELAIRLGVTAKHVNKIINGTASISHKIALKLESVLGISAKFWNKLQMNYNETKSRLEEISQLEKESKILKFIPYNEMANFNWVPKTSDIKEKVKNLRSYFRIATLDNLQLTHSVAFRKSDAFKANEYALASWLNQGELQATDLNTKPYSKKSFEKIFPELKLLTKKPLKASRKELVQLCASIGIAVVFVPNLTGTHVNGATRWLSNEKAMIIMSTKGQYEDIFWFSFFHEIGHILQQKKNTTFIDEEIPENINESEIEANEFSSNFLISNKDYKNFIDTKDYTDISEIRKFSEKVDIHIGIIIGRLLHDNYISYKNKKYKKYEQLRRKYSI